MSQQKFTLQCPQCGGSRFRASSPKPSPDDPLTCSQCGATVVLREVKERLEREARAAVEERLRNQVKPPS